MNKSLEEIRKIIFERGVFIQSINDDYKKLYDNVIPFLEYDKEQKKIAQDLKDKLGISLLKQDMVITTHMAGLISTLMKYKKQYGYLKNE